MQITHRLRTRLSDQQGSALIIALMAMMLLTALGAAVVMVSNTETHIAGNYRNSQEALYAADAAVERVLADLDGLPPLALRTAKRVLNHVYDAPLSVGLELEGLAYGLLRTTDDFREGVEAFGEKRTPRFEGR